DTSVHSELATKASSDDVKSVDTKVVGVRTDLDTTREDLKMAKSEMGTLIARNHDEIDQLRRLGERDYTEFTITGRNRPQKVANVLRRLGERDYTEFTITGRNRPQKVANVTVELKGITKSGICSAWPWLWKTSALRRRIVR